jgi:hypothetical protein
VDPGNRLKEVRLEGPASGDLDRFPLEESAGELYVLLPD